MVALDVSESSATWNIRSLSPRLHHKVSQLTNTFIYVLKLLCEWGSLVNNPSRRGLLSHFKSHPMNKICLNQNMKIKLIVEHFKKMREIVMMKVVRKATDRSESYLGKTKIVGRNIFFLLSPSQLRPALCAYVAVWKVSQSFQWIKYV